MAIGRDVFPYGIYMLTYEHVTNTLAHLLGEPRRTSRNSADMMITVIAGAVAGECALTMYLVLHYAHIMPFDFTSVIRLFSGLMSWVLVIPFDVIKTITQAQYDPAQYTSMREIMKTKVDVSMRQEDVIFLRMPHCTVKTNEYE